jgi:hypothetical protein
MSLIAFIDGEINGSSGGMVLNVLVKDKYDMDGIMHFVESVKYGTAGMVQTITIVNLSKKKIDSPYIHPPIKDRANSDGSFDFGGKKWLELILKVNLTGEEE